MADSPSFNWLLKPTDPIVIKALVLELCDEFSSHFNLDIRVNDTLLNLFPGGFYLTLGTQHAENQIHPLTYEGAGEILSKHGNLGLLFFATLRKRIAHKLPQETTPSISFSNEQGEAISLLNMSELEAECKRLGDTSKVLRADAEAVGFVERFYHLDRSSDTDQSLFF